MAGGSKRAAASIPCRGPPVRSAAGRPGPAIMLPSRHHIRGSTRHGLGQQSHPHRQPGPRPRGALHAQRLGRSATSRWPPAAQWKDKTSGDKQEETEWHRVVFYDRLAEIAGEYLKKGRPVYVEGRLKTRKWTDKDGVEKYTTEIVADRDAAARQPRRHGRRRRRRWRRRRRTAASARRARPASRRRRPSRPPKSSTGFDDMDDDIPF